MRCLFANPAGPLYLVSLQENGSTSRELPYLCMIYRAKDSPLLRQQLWPGAHHYAPENRDYVFTKKGIQSERLNPLFILSKLKAFAFTVEHLFEQAGFRSQKVREKPLRIFSRLY